MPLRNLGRIAALFSVRERRLKFLGKNFIAPIQSIRFNALQPIVLL